MTKENFFITPKQEIAIAVDDTKSSSFKSISLTRYNLTLGKLVPSNRIKISYYISSIANFFFAVVVGFFIFAIYREFLIQSGESEGVRNALFENILPAICGWWSSLTVRFFIFKFQ